MYIQSILLFTMKRATLIQYVFPDIYICLIKQNQSGKMLFFKFFFLSIIFGHDLYKSCLPLP